MYKDILGKDKGTTEINGKKYFFKRNDAYVEVLVEKIADLFGLKHAHYFPITLYGKNYYLSEDLNYQGQFETAFDVGIDTLDLRYIRDYVLNCYPNDFDHLMDDIMKMFFMDLMILNIDRNNCNWGFITKDGRTDLCILDNDLSFIFYNSCMTSCINPKQDSYVEVMNIFDTFPQSYVEMFREMYNTLDSKKLIELIKETEEDLGFPLPHKDNYLQRFESFRSHIELASGKKNLQYKKAEG